MNGVLESEYAPDEKKHGLVNTDFQRKETSRVLITGEV